MKGQFEFNWLFALILGAVILFLAIFFAGKLIGTSQLQSGAEIVREFDILLNPFSSVGAVGTITLAKEVSMPSEILINISCSSEGLGKNGISVAQKSGSKYTELTKEYAIYNKYIFGENLQGKEFYIFGMPFEMPFRIDDLIYVVSDNYCFVDAPEKIRDDISILNTSRIVSKDSTVQCPAESKRVCFSDMSGCSMSVYCDDIGCEQGTAVKAGKVYFYKKSLMYAAVFSDVSLYRCNLKRLLARADSISDIYQQKSYRLAADCEMYGINNALASFKSKIASLKSSLSPDPRTLAIEANRLDTENSIARCPVY